MRMVARRRKHKDGCRQGEGEDLRMVARRRHKEWLQGKRRHKDGCKATNQLR
jgi:hypothetical protein